MVTFALSDVSIRLGGRDVIGGISATLFPGALIGIIGPNGAGKSTLIRTLLGLLAPSSGSVALDQVPISTLPRKMIARSVAYLPQGQTLHWPMTVERLVALGRLPHLAPMSRVGPQDLAIIDAAMARTDVGHLRSRPATELSGGERARVLLARALAVGAPGLIVDEPLASLDPGHQIDVMELLAREAAAGSLVITVLHDLNMAARYCDRLLLLDHGTLVADGPPLAVLTPDRLQTVYGIRAEVGMSAGLPMVVPLARASRELAGRSTK